MNLLISKNLNHKKIIKTSVILILVTSVLGFLIIPNILHCLLRKVLVLKPEGTLRKLWEKAPFAVDFKVYMFNVTNPDEVMKGGKPMIHEIGPYMFDEWKEKYNFVDHEDTDTVEFEMKNTFVFRQDKSGGLTGMEVVTMPHLLVMGALISVQRDFAPLLDLATKAMEQIFNLNTPFLTASVMDILFNGIGIDCNHTEFEAISFCEKIKAEAKGLNIVNDTYIEFSVLGGANDTSMGHFEVFRGIKDITKLGQMVKFNNEIELDVWDGDECNQLLGTDSTIFAPFHDTKDLLWAFGSDLCRSLAATYEKKSEYNGIPTAQYGMNLGDLKNEPTEQCYCRDPPEGCPLKGTLDMSPCVGFPLVISKPHFYGTDPILLEKVDGLNPIKDQHDIFLHIEMITGSPLSAAKRLQFNLEMETVESFEPMANLPSTLIPMFWVEESVSLNETITKPFRYGLYLLLKINNCTRYGGLAIGVLGLIFSFTQLFLKKDSLVVVNENVNRILPVIPLNSRRNSKIS